MKFLTDTTRWLVIVLASVLALGCDLFGDDDDDGGGGLVDVVVLPTYAYTMVSVADDPITVAAPLGDNGDVTLRLSHLEPAGGMFGTYTVDEGVFTVSAGSSLVVDELGDQIQFQGDFDIEVTSDWTLPVDGPPTEGALKVTSREILRNESVYVEVTSTGSVTLSHDALDDGTIDEEITLSWEELDDVMDSDAPDWQKLAVFAIQVGGEFVLELAGYGIGGLELVVDELADASPVTVACDSFSSIGLAVPPPPPDIPDAGMLTFTWVDDALDGLVGPGDSFDIDSMYCLAVMEPLEDEQIMLNGLVSLNSYTEVVEDNTLVRIGFEGTSPGGRAGGVHFSDLERYEVYGSGGSNVATVHLGALINGRMTLVFTEPAN